MKAARYTIAAIELACPYCDEAITYDGSEFITRQEFELAPDMLVCQNCGKASGKPAITFEPKRKATKQAQSTVVSSPALLAVLDNLLDDGWLP